jgi:hypothetical protein
MGFKYWPSIIYWECLTIFQVRKKIKLEIPRLSNLLLFFFYLFRSGRYLGKPRKVLVTNFGPIPPSTSRAEPIEADLARW